MGEKKRRLLQEKLKSGSPRSELDQEIDEILAKIGRLQSVLLCPEQIKGQATTALRQAIKQFLRGQKAIRERLEDKAADPAYNGRYAELLATFLRRRKEVNEGHPSQIDETVLVELRRRVEDLRVVSEQVERALKEPMPSRQNAPTETTADLDEWAAWHARQQQDSQ